MDNENKENTFLHSKGFLVLLIVWGLGFLSIFPGVFFHWDFTTWFISLMLFILIPHALVFTGWGIRYQNRGNFWGAGMFWMWVGGICLGEVIGGIIEKEDRATWTLFLLFCVVMCIVVFRSAMEIPKSAKPLKEPLDTAAIKEELWERYGKKRNGKG